MTNQPFLQEVENDSGLNNLESTQDWLKENKIDAIYDKKKIANIIKKYKPQNIFYFAGQSLSLIHI